MVNFGGNPYVRSNPLSSSVPFTGSLNADSLPKTSTSSEAFGVPKAGILGEYRWSAARKKSIIGWEMAKAS